MDKHPSFCVDVDGKDANISEQLSLFWSFSNLEGVVCFCRTAATYPAIMSQQDGVALDVSVDHALSVQDRQRLQHRQTHGGDLLLVHPAESNRNQSHLGFSFSGF